MSNQGLLEDGRMAAVKALLAESTVGLKEFLNKIMRSKKIMHSEAVWLWFRRKPKNFGLRIPREQ